MQSHNSATLKLFGFIKTFQQKTEHFVVFRGSILTLILQICDVIIAIKVDCGIMTLEQCTMFWLQCTIYERFLVML